MEITRSLHRRLPSRTPASPQPSATERRRGRHMGSGLFSTTAPWRRTRLVTATSPTPVDMVKDGMRSATTNVGQSTNCSAVSPSITSEVPGAMTDSRHFGPDNERTIFEPVYNVLIVTDGGKIGPVRLMNFPWARWRRGKR